MRATRNELHRLLEAADAARKAGERLGEENEEMVGEGVQLKRCLAVQRAELERLKKESAGYISSGAGAAAAKECAL